MSDELVCAASELARNNSTHLTFHISPSTDDTASYLARTGKHPVRHLYDLGALGPHVLLAHAVHLNEDEIDCVVSANAAVAVCPWAYLRLAQGITAGGRHDEMLRRGVRIALGCDSENSGDAVDPIRNAALFAGLMRDKSMDPFSYSAVDALAQHTIEAARAIGMEDKIGSLEVGKQADLVVFQTSGPEWITRSSNPVLQLIWSSNGASVADVFVAGKQVVRGRKCITVDIAAAAEEAQKRAQILGQTIRP
jgi:5-methylthioadenosine/S-adenosylhomocysteine deaminase